MPKNNNISVSLPILGKVDISFYCLAEQVLKIYKELSEIDRQKDIHQLGLISTVLEGASHTRYEYILLQAGLTDLLDKLYKGSPTAAQGGVKVNGTEYKGNGLIKSWLLLSNFGHAKNTIGDEKSLLIFARNQPGFKSTLLRPIRDPLLKKWATTVIDNFDYINVHHILSIRRLYKELSRQQERQDLTILAYKLLLIDYEKLDVVVDNIKLERLRRLFKTIRALSIVSIDGHYSHVPISIDLISILLSIDLLENSYRDVYLLESIKPILSVLHEGIYLDKDVLARQRDYEVKSLAYLKTQPKTPTSYEACIKKALLEGLIDIDECSLKHFARFPIPKIIQPNIELYDHFRRLQMVRKQCVNVEPSLDYNPITQTRYADFFIHKDKFGKEDLPRFVFNICTLIAQHISTLKENVSMDYSFLVREIKEVAIDEGLSEGLIDEILSKSTKAISSEAYQKFKEDIFPSYKDLLWSILSYFFDSKYHLDIQLPSKEYDIFGMKFSNGDMSFLKNIFEQAKVQENNSDDRLHEIKQAEKVTQRSYGGFILVCLARVMIYDKTKSPNERLVTDIDSLTIKVDKEELIVELNESKNRKRSKETVAAKEIRKNLVPVLNNNSKGYRVRHVKGFGAKLVLKC